MQQFGEKQLQLHLEAPVSELPAALVEVGLQRSENGETLLYNYAKEATEVSVVDLLNLVQALGITVKDVDTHRSSLEDIFVSLMEKKQ